VDKKICWKDLDVTKGGKPVKGTNIGDSPGEGGSHRGGEEGAIIGVRGGGNVPYWGQRGKAKSILHKKTKRTAEMGKGI